MAEPAVAQPRRAGENLSGGGAMLAAEFLRFLTEGFRDLGMGKRLRALVDELSVVAHAARALKDDAAFVQYSRTRFLPAARRYREYLLGRITLDEAQGRSLRARLGGYSRWMYQRQRETFNDVLSLLVEDVGGAPLTESQKDFLWHLFLGLERQLLAHSRAQR